MKQTTADAKVIFKKSYVLSINFHIECFEGYTINHKICSLKLCLYTDFSSINIMEDECLKKSPILHFPDNIY
jgi:hypothetical protein